MKTGQKSWNASVLSLYELRSRHFGPTSSFSGQLQAPWWLTVPKAAHSVLGAQVVSDSWGTNLGQPTATPTPTEAGKGLCVCVGHLLP